MYYRSHRVALIALGGITSVLLVLYLAHAPRVSQDLPSPASSSQASLPPPAIHLVSGDVMTANLESNSTHRYTLWLESDQLLHAVVEQHGLDVVVALLGEEEEVVVEVDSPTGGRGEEALWYVAPYAGNLELEVRSWGATESGEYLLRVEIGNPTPEDRKRANASFLISSVLKEFRTQSADTTVIRNALQRAEGLWSLVGETRLQALALYQRAAMELGAEQIHLYSEARDLFLQAKDRGMEIASLHRLGRAWREAGDPVRAQARQVVALELARQSGDRANEAVSLQNLAVLARGQGKLRVALSLFQEALEILRHEHRLDEMANTLQNLGHLYTLLGHLPEAVDVLEEAREITVDLADPARRAACLTELAWVRFRLGQSTEALSIMKEALELRRLAHDRTGEGATLERLGMVQQGVGLLDEAATSYESALLRFTEAGLVKDRASVTGHQASLFLDRGLPMIALKLSQEALLVFRTQGDLSGEAYALHLIARAEAALGQLDAARKAAAQGLAVTEGQRGELELSAASMPFLATRRMYLELYVGVLMRLHHEDRGGGWDLKALGAVERFRMRHLLDLLESPRKSTDAEAESILRTLEAEIHRLEAERRHAVVKADEHERDRLGGEIRTLLNRRAEVESSQRRLTTLRSSRPLEGLEIEALLAEDGASLLLVYFLAEDAGTLWAVGPDGVTSLPLPPRVEVETTARRALEEIQGHGSGGSATQAAAEMLLGPIRERLLGRRLLIEGEGALHYLPFGALPRDASKKLVITRHEVVRVPSVTVAMALRERAVTGAAAQKAVAVFADPVLRWRGNSRPLTLRQSEGKPASDLERSVAAIGLDALKSLPASRKEALFISSLVPPEETLLALGLSANREQVLSPNLLEYRIVHFATHSLVHDLRPELSGLVLSLVDGEGHPKDGFLRAHEISQLKLSAELVVLSACSTALGEEVRGEGLQSLAQGFFDAGAHRVAASLWRVNDQATAVLMQDFYRALLVAKMPPAAALRSAQLKMLASKTWSDPAYWAAFELQGDWSPEGWEKRKQVRQREGSED